MADVVHGNMMVVFLKLGSVYYPIACAKDSQIVINSETIELAPRLSKDFREYRYGRKTGKITGSGLTKINTDPDNLYTVFDLMGYQLASQMALVKYSVEDPQGNTKVFECEAVITETGLGKTSGQSGTHSFELTISGPPTMASTPVENTNPQILVYEYTATGGEVALDLPISPSGTVLLVEYGSIGAIPVYIYPDGYGPGEVQYNPATGQMLFGDIMTAGLYIRILYVDVDSVADTSLYLEDGTGEFIEDGTGAEITSG